MSAFFFRAQENAAARSDGGLKGDGTVYAVSARESDTVAGHPECYSYLLRKAVDGGDFRLLRRKAPPYVRKFSILICVNLFVVDPVFSAVIQRLSWKAAAVGAAMHGEPWRKAGMDGR